MSHHAGTLTITGTAARLEVVRPAMEAAAPTRAHVGGSVNMVTDAKAALTQMGWKAALAHAAVDAAAAAIGDASTLEQLLVEALRRCAQSRSALSTAKAPS